MAVPAFNQPESVVAKIVANVNDVAVLPHVVFKVMEMTGSDESSAASLEKAIVVDPGFTVKILTLANSAHFGLPKKVTSIREALMFVGFRSVRQIAMAVGVYDMFVGKNDKESLRRRAWWRLSVDTATAAKTIAQELKVGSVDECYTAGLLHLVGKPAADRFSPSTYDKVEMLVERGAPSWQAEQAVFGCHHGQVSSALAQNWNLPEALVNGVNYVYDDPDHATRDEISATVAIGHRVCQMLIRGVNTDTVHGHTFPEVPCAILGLSSKDIHDIYRLCTQSISDSNRLSL